MNETLTPESKAARWWYQIQPGGGTPDSAGLAQLRRISTPQDALMHPAAVELAIRLDRYSFDDRSVACQLGVLLAHVRQGSNERSIAARLGAGSSGTRKMSEVRFRTLMQSAAGAERMTAFRRAIQMLDGTVNVERLARAWLYWDAGERGRRLRTEWMFDYVGSGLAGPDDKQPESENTVETNR